jgi:hypothetical protein
MSDLDPPADSSFYQVDSLLRVFTGGFSAAQIAEPLRSFEAAAPAAEIAALMREQRLGVAGLRRDGLVVGYFEIPEEPEGACENHLRGFEGARILHDSAPLNEVIAALDEVPRVFVRGYWQIAGVITRYELQKAPVRMWLFGMLTLIEMRMTGQIEEHYPDDSWSRYLSPARLEGARRLLEERRRRNQDLTILDCLQFADKAQIFARSQELRETTRYTSRKQLEKVAKILQRLRNNLAHSQDIITNDWEAIVDLSASMRQILNPPERRRRATDDSRL